VPRTFSGFPQFNWPVLAPLLCLFVLVIGISGFVYGSLLVDDSSGAISSSGGRTVGRGGGIDLRPPELVRSKVLSLSARVVGAPMIRRGPGTQYAEVKRAADGEEYHVVACSPGCEWLQVFSLSDPGQWWLPSSFLSVSGKVEQLQVLTPVDNYGR
jgi:hypothetical protein